MNYKKQKKPTIKDVASLANVSVASVSRYINNAKGHLSKEKAKQIARAVAMLHYVPNTAARAIKTKQSKMIAVVMANIDDYFSTEVFKGASEICQKAGYQCLLLDTGADQEREKKLLQKVRNNNFDGLLFQPLSSNVDLISDEILHDLPTVIIDRRLATRRWSQVVSNNFESAKRATIFFINSEKCSNILILSSKISIASTRRERYDGILNIAKKGRARTIEISEKGFKASKIIAKIEHYLDRNIKHKRRTLIFCLKERWLLTFIPSLIADGYMNNGKTLVTGFADTSLSHILLPQTHLISQKPKKMGKIAAQILLSKLTAPKANSKAKIFTVKTRFS